MSAEVNLKPSEILSRAWGIVSVSPTSDFYAKDAEGNVCDPWDAKACSFCSAGAVIKVMGERLTGHHGLQSAAYLNRAAAELKYPSLVSLNDHAPHLREEMFTRAIALAKAAGE